MAKYKKQEIKKKSVIKEEPKKEEVIPIVAKPKGEVAEANVKQPIVVSKPYTTEDLNLVYKLQSRGIHLQTVEGPNPFHKGNLYIFKDSEDIIKEALSKEGLQ